MGLTLLRILLLPVFLWLVLSGAEPDPGPRPSRWWAIFVFGVMALTDKLDGYLARKLNQVSRIGTLLDPVADKLLVACSVILLSFGWVSTRAYSIPLPVVITIYGGYLLIAIGSLAMLKLVGRVRITPRPLGKMNTFLQLTLVMLTLIAPTLRYPNTAWVPAVLRLLWWVVPLIVVAASIDYTIQGVKQLKKEEVSQL